MSNLIKDIPLSLSESYVNSWGIEEGVREFIQNALDCDNHEVWNDEDGLHINSYDGTIDHKHLLLGSGAKTLDGTSIGGHNEGFKLAFLVMARENVDITFTNGKEKWIPYFKFNEDFGENCLHIRIESCDWSVEDRVMITINGLAPEDETNFLETKPLDNIINNTLVLQDQSYNKHETSYGEILLSEQHKGKIFCGGLFVQELKGFQEGFNFKPSQLTLDRDRRMLQAFDIMWITKEAWAEVSKDAEGDVAEYIVEGITNKSKSMKFLDSTHCDVSEEIKDKVLEVYKDKYNGKLLASSYEQKESLIIAGNDNADYIDNDAFLHVLNQTEEYQTIKLGTKREKPMEWLDSWKDQFYNELSDEALYAYEDMCVKLQKVLK